LLPSGNFAAGEPQPLSLTLRRRLEKTGEDWRRLEKTGEELKATRDILKNI
jgi:hypothetical protein